MKAGTAVFPGEKGTFARIWAFSFGGVSMKSSFVTRDQFDISPEGVVHKPTGAAFTPHPGDRYSGT
jgi:hypothetical protein